MKILKVRVKNLNSLRLEESIDFDTPPLSNTGLFAITGDTGAGKTTLLDAITLALYGKIHRNKEVKEVMTYGTTECYAEVEFSIKKEIYRAKWSIWRARAKADGNILGPNRELATWNKKKSDFEIIAEKIKEMDEQVENITGLDYDRFSRSVMLSQGDFAAFLKSGEKERSELLERITGTAIYSDLSKAAFERHKLERERYKSLELEKENLQLLDAEELQELQTHSKQFQKESKSQQKALTNKRQQLQWWINIENLATKLDHSTQAIAQLEAQKVELQPEWEQLEWHQKTLPFEARLEKMNDLERQQQQILEEAQKSQFEIAQFETTESQYQQELANTQVTLKTLKKEQSEQETLLAQVIPLDATIKEKIGPLQRQKTALETHQSQFQNNQTKTADLASKIQQLITEQDEHKTWLLDHTSLAQLSNDLPLIDARYKDLRAIFTQRKDNEELVKTNEAKCQKAQKVWSIVQRDLDKTEKQREKLLADFLQSAPENYALSRNDLLNKINDEIVHLSDHNKNLQQLRTLNETYQSLLQDLNASEDQLENLRQEELEVNKQMMTSLELMDRLKEQLEFKQQIFEQQRMIANYEQDRTNLQEGDACPLCFSKTHPFREKQFKPFVDKAAAELKQVRERYDLYYKEHRKLLNRQQDLEVQIENFAGNEVNQLSGQVNKQVNRILEFESTMTKIAPEFAQEDFAITRQHLLHLKIKDFTTKLKERKAAREALKTLDQALNEQEALIKEQQDRLVEEKLQLTRLEEQLEGQKEQLKLVEEKFLTTEKELNAVLQIYGFQFSVKTGKEVYDTLTQRKQEYENRLQRQQQLKGEIDLLNQEKEQVTKEQKKLQEQIAALADLVKTEQDALETLNEQRQSLFGDRDPVLEKQHLGDRLQRIEAKLEQGQKIWQEAQVSLKTTRAKNESQKQQGIQIKSQLTQVSAALLPALLEVGFADLQQVQQARLSESAAQLIQSKSTTWQNQNIEQQKLQKTLQEELAAERKKQPSDATQEQISAELTELEATAQALQQQIGAINEKIQRHEQQEQASKDLVERMNQQLKEYNRWSRLNDIIGMADGKKFRVFAQGLTLSKLAVLANRHLQQLNPRYFIHKPSDADLSLEIIDTYQADNNRSMNTLSGGESFLVSLALALGLSDLAGRNTNIRSLFIDEGFGSLDEATLDLAISTLENLQASGKTIGVISHVKALKERISTQIVVNKKGSGFSAIKIVG